ncbi:GIY-YIG nuclease family protein [Cloacibacillus sp. An23]|uniref:GIY-YIG nuclease family protein n=1 Tax=Cloacibacillus sp. An23 TaxID=1965591 RepID=UPI00210180DC|nr:GIY-YIG nuclease family protein [Cloacibacillus sp. An23]
MKNGVIYIGVASDLPRRVGVRNSRELNGFSRKYNADKPVWYRFFDTMEEAVQAEKRMKEWNRAWKIREIEKLNPEWRDLAEGEL